MTLHNVIQYTILCYTNCTTTCYEDLAQAIGGPRRVQPTLGLGADAAGQLGEGDAEDPTSVGSAGCGR
eukprot:2031980-Heterocapsa_arctica.AAC.1